MTRGTLWVVLRIDHIALGVQNLFEGAERLRAETGFGDAEGGWFPGIGAANRIVPLGSRQYLEVESVVDAFAAERTGGRWFRDQLRAGDVFLGWCAGVDDREELDGYAEWFGAPVDETATRVNADGSVRGSPRVPSAPDAWRRGLPNVFRMDPATHPAGSDVRHTREPGGIAWMEVGGAERDMRAWLGSGVDDLPLRYNHRPHGVYAVAVHIADEDGASRELVVRRRPVLLGSDA